MFPSFFAPAKSIRSFEIGSDNQKYPSHHSRY
jgi:hypothetical protein